MNNLLKTLSDSKVKTLPDVDLKSLLATVKDGRGRRDDNSLSNAFYESLEGVLADLKTVTLDNHDAEAFLKPVLKAEVADYYDVISNPMDFQTMNKKLKARQYKSKKEFKDDLDLIWSNCCTYNSTEGHHLPKAALRLKAKADKLLANITDRKERADPHIPYDFSGALHPKINGINGRAHTRSPSVASTSSSKLPTITIKTSSLGKAITKIPRRDTSFEESPALIRTPEGMSTFRDLDRGLQQAGLPSPNSDLESRMREIVPSEHEDEYDSESAQLGDKRKVVNGINDHRTHKRARFATPLPTSDSTPGSPTTISKDDDLTQLWWSTVQADALLPNGLPEIPVASSSLRHSFSKHPISKSPAQTAKKKKRRKKLPDSYRPEDKPKALLTLMNNNVRTIKRVRHTHARFAALGLTKDSGAGNEDGEGAESGPSFSSGATAAAGSGPSLGTGGLGADPMDVEEAIDDRVDERPWEIPTIRGRKLSGIEIGSQNANDCLQWMNGKVLEHAGFQGTSKAALDVLSGVASEYLLNVGRTIKFLCDKFAHTMSSEEIVLHTLFESGISEIQDLERYVADDVERYGSRLADLEKKLVGAYREVTSVETLEDEGLFDEEEEDETSALALGEFADTLGVDYLGLRELGIADEFGMSSLTIPRRLLKGKKRRTNLLPAAKPTEPPPPFPPPPPFIPLTAGQIPEQIGLLHKFYNDRLQVAIPPHAPMSLPIPPLAPPPLPGPSLSNPYPHIPSLPKPFIPTLLGPPRPGAEPTLAPTSTLNTLPQMHNTASPLPPASLHPPDLSQEPLSQLQQSTLPPPPPPETVIPDDPPLPVQVKMGPIGQIVKTGSSYPAAKKKAKTGIIGASSAGNGAASTSNVNTNANLNTNPANNVDNNTPLSATSNPSSAGILLSGSLANGVAHPGHLPEPGSGSINHFGNGIAPGSSDTSTMTTTITTDDPAIGPVPSPKKKKGATGVGTGNGRKKRMLDAAQGQTQAQAQAQTQGQTHTHPSQNQPGQGHGQDPRRPPFPPFVAASA